MPTFHYHYESEKEGSYKMREKEQKQALPEFAYLRVEKKWTIRFLSLLFATTSARELEAIDAILKSNPTICDLVDLLNATCQTKNAISG